MVSVLPLRVADNGGKVGGFNHRSDVVPGKPHLFMWSMSAQRPWVCRGKGLSYLGETVKEAYDGWYSFAMMKSKEIGRWRYGGSG